MAISTPDWRKAVDLGDQAFEEAKAAFALHEAGASEESQAIAEAAVQQLAKSANIIPIPKDEFLPGLTREMASK
ncbi:hypothetical protein SI65_08390 [Aspergillus cristatus]|uniref:Uncharacterized protein n=1 Tax=Aspergillus cristatus TaxID=573508 RepID=A0A1E3B601_ASPCR|nr:hypothetical protein SI65_08390 [Aspergillus cristatus]